MLDETCKELKRPTTSKFKGASQSCSLKVPKAECCFAEIYKLGNSYRKHNRSSLAPFLRMKYLAYFGCLFRLIAVI